jgi:hypothetical protein
MEINLDDARTIAVALNIYNKKLVEEFEKIRNTPDVSDFVTNAAHRQYQELTEAGTKLHAKLAQEFPELTQR